MFITKLAERKRWLIVALLFSLSVINYLDRQSLSVLAPSLRQQLGFGEVEYSYVVTAFLVAYAIGYSFCGRVLDRIGVKAGLAFAIVFWSLSGMLHAVAAGWMALAVCRFLLGLGESFTAPGGAKAISEWAPQKERGLSMAIFSNGFLWGGILAPPIVSLIALKFGWQSAFLLTGAVGFIWLVVWLLYYESPEKHQFISENERAYILEKRGVSEQEKISFWQIIKHPYCYGLFVARFLTDPLPYFFSFWMPEYLQSNRGFTLAMIGALGWIPFLAADVGGPGGGALSDFLVRRGWEPKKARLRLMLIAACLMPLALVAVHTTSTALSVGIIAVLLGAHSCWTVNMLTTTAEAFPRGQVGTLVALSAMGGSIGGIISTLATGRVIAAYGYIPVFTVLAFLHITAYIFLSFVIKRRPTESLQTSVGSPLKEAA